MWYGDKEQAKVMIYHALKENGWKCYGYKEDQSDSMTDYYDPASWCGISEKNGYILLIDQYGTSYSGYEVKKYNYNKSKFTANERITKLTAMMNDTASTENEKASCKVLIEKEMEKLNVEPEYTIIETYPIFNFANPKNCSWHIEKDNQIIAKGTGVFAVNESDWQKEESAADQKKAKLGKLIKRFENAIKKDTALESEVIKVAKKVIKPVELDKTEITESDIKLGLQFIYKVDYTQGNYKGTKYELIHIDEKYSKYHIFAKLGKTGKPSKSRNNQVGHSLDKLNERLQKGHIAIVEMQEFTEYEEKTVYKKTAKKQKANFDNVALSGDIQQQEETTTEEERTNNNDVTYNNSNTSEQATKRQKWALHCATNLDTRELNISKEKASELIGRSKNGEDIVGIIQDMLNGNEDELQDNKQTLEQINEDVETLADLLTEEILNKGFNNYPDNEEERESINNSFFQRIKEHHIKITSRHIEQSKILGYSRITEIINESRTKSSNNRKQQKAQDQTILIPKIEKQIKSNENKLEKLSGEYLTNTWKRQKEAESRDQKKDGLRFEISLLEYLKDKASNNNLTVLEQSMITGSIRDRLNSYHNQKYGKYPKEVQYPQIDYNIPLEGWWNKEVPKMQKRLNKAGIYNTEQLIKAVEEYKAIKENIETPKNPITEKIKKLENEVKLRKIDGYFPTPKNIVQRMIELADITDGEKVLEPSAGNGNILDGIQDYITNNSITADIEGIECNYSLRSILELKEYKLVANDFLEYAKYNHYNKIIMNPPFEKVADIDHVKHAYKHLADSGKIVAIMSPHFTFASDSKSIAFREWLNERGYYEKLPEGTFKESGTNVNTILVVIDKLEETAAEAI